MTETYAEFMYPGTFFSESSTRKIPSREKIGEWPERAYAVRTYELFVSDVDGERVTGRPRDHSGWTFKGGRVMTLEEVKAEEPGAKILISNMEGNGWAGAGGWQRKPDAQATASGHRPRLHRRHQLSDVSSDRSAGGRMNQRASVTELFDDFELVVLAGGVCGVDAGRPEGDYAVTPEPPALFYKYANMPLPKDKTDWKKFKEEYLKKMHQMMQDGLLGGLHFVDPGPAPPPKWKPPKHDWTIEKDPPGPPPITEL